MTCGLTKKVFNYDYLYHTPHGEDLRTVNLTKPMNSMLMTFVNKSSLENVIWNNDHHLQQFKIFVINKDFIICDRIKNNEYTIDSQIYEEAIIKTTALLKSWKVL